MSPVRAPALELAPGLRLLILANCRSRTSRWGAGRDSVRGHVRRHRTFAINKRFGEVHANKDVNLTVERGTIHGIVGENGAGKSTLMSILYGFYEADSGEIHVNGKPVSIRSRPMPSMSASAWCTALHAGRAADGGRERDARRRRRRDAARGRSQGAGRTRAARARLRPRDRCRRHRGRSRSACSSASKFSALSRRGHSHPRRADRGAHAPEADALFELLGAEGPGKTVILITHKLREIMAVTDRVSVMRRGEMVATVETANTSPPELAELMVGRRVLLRVEKSERGQALHARGREPVGGRPSRRAASRECRVQGSRGRDRRHRRRGRQRPERTPGGHRRHAPARSRTMRFEGREIRFTDHNPHRMRQLGLLHVPEDRLRMGLVPAFPAFECHPRLQRRATARFGTDPRP